jgi:hypothetical protein
VFSGKTQTTFCHFNQFWTGRYDFGIETGSDLASNVYHKQSSAKPDLGRGQSYPFFRPHELQHCFG